MNMPNMDGYRLTQRIRQLGLTLPVVGVTANALAEEKQRCSESGMDSCLSKPVTLDVLKQTLSIYADREKNADIKRPVRASSPSPRGEGIRSTPVGSILIRRAQRHGGEIVQQRDIVVHAQFHHG